MKNYTIGTSSEVENAYPSLLLFECFLLQKQFYINSDPELENQINNRLSFKKLLRLSLSKPSPGHSIFFHLRNRLSKEAADQIKKLKDKRKTPKGKLNKNGKFLKFSRKFEPDWTAKNDKPHYGLKEQASADINHGFILASKLTPFSAHDTNCLQCNFYSQHT